MLGLETSQARSPRAAAWAPRPFWKAPPRASVPVSLAQLVSASYGAGQMDAIIPPPQNFAQLERKYGTSAPIFICVRRKGRDLASAPFKVSRQDGTGKKTPMPAADPLAQLLHRPNPWMTGAQLVYFCSMFLDLTGNFFLLILRDRKGVPRELYPVNPLAVSILGSMERLVSSYVMYHFGAAVELKAYGPGQLGDLLHFKLPAPGVFHGTLGESAFPSPWGVGPLEAAWDLVTTWGDATVWNRTLVKNQGRPSGMLTSDLDVDNVTADEAMARWARVHGGPENAGKILVLGKNLKYSQLSMSPKDMDYIATRKELWHEIVAIFDLNGTVLGFTEGDVGRRDEQIRDYWRGTIVSTSQADVCPPINEHLAKEFGEDYVVEQDFAHVRELQPEWIRLAPMITSMFGAGVSMQTISGVLALEIPQYPGWERSFISASLVPLEQAGLPIGLPPAPADQGLGPVST